MLFLVDINGADARNSRLSFRGKSRFVTLVTVCPVLEDPGSKDD